MECCKSLKNCEDNQDRISNLPSLVTDKILKRLPLRMVAEMSMLSTKWRANWVSHRYLVFDEAFWKGQHDSGTRVNNAIINTFLHHNGPLHKFHLHIPEFKGKRINLNQYLSFLSRTCVKKLLLINWDEYVADSPFPSHLFACKELVKLRLEYVTLCPPRGFKGFAHLRSLELVNVEFKHDVLGSLVTSCPRLQLLRLEDFIGITTLVIDAPNLEILLVRGGFASIDFRSVARLNRTSLCFEPAKGNTALHDDIFNSIKLLATSSEIQHLTIGDDLCQLLAVGGFINSLPLPFNRLKELYLMELNLGDFNVFRFMLGMIQSCPCIEHLDISVTENTSNVGHQHNIGFNDSYKLNHLKTMKITGITGSTAELKLLGHVLSISVVLESLYFKYGNLDPNSKLKVSNDLLRLRRASPKAQLVRLNQ